MADMDENIRSIQQLETRVQQEEKGKVGIQGPNFSSRTTLLRKFADRKGASEKPSIYIGPDPETSITGARSLVRTEISLQMVRNDEERWWEAAKEVGLTDLLDRKPFTLSGGEKATLVVMTGLALAPDRLSIDCTLEQTNVSLKEKVLEAIGWLSRDTNLLFADNRLTEVEYDFPTVSTDLPPNVDLPYQPINSDVQLPLHPEQTGTLSIENLYFGYTGETNVLKGLDLQLKPGEVYALTGKTGAGKSTLAKLLVGDIRPDRGKIFYEGEQHVPWKNPGQVVAYHLQNPDHQFFTGSIEAEIKAAPRKLGVERERTEARYRALKEAFGFSGLGEEAEPLDPEAIPYSIRKRIAMAATLASARPWIVLDEPNLGQDDRSLRALAALIEQIAEKGIGMIIISHSTYLRSLLSAKELRLKDGTIRS
jgi:energy-coupling factor transporter ATP-binding protein EcfA2